MKLAVTYDFKNVIDYRREGICVYVKFLLSALMEYDSTLELEFWVYHINEDYLKKLFSDIFHKYKNRVKVFVIDKYLKINKLHYKHYFPYLADYSIKKILYKAAAVINRTKYEAKLNELEVNKLNDIFYINYSDLSKIIKRVSHADAVYVMFVNLELGTCFSCPKFLQVHDLFTFVYTDLFSKYWGSDNLEKHNRDIAAVLNKYASENTIFISSSEYTVNEHSLKFINNITKEKTAVIQFPPLVKDFDTNNIMRKEDFKAKYGIWEKYTAMPSQNRPNKNWQVIFKAIARLKSKGINLQFVTTGTVAHLKEIEQLVHELGIEENILEIGSVSERDLYMLYKYEDVAIGSTVIEGMGISGQVIEALKAGNIPAVHSKCYGLKESLSAVGLSMKTADLNWFELDDDKRLAEVIEDMLSNPVPHILKQKHVIDAYMSVKWEDVAKKYLKLFNENINSVKYTK